MKTLADLKRELAVGLKVETLFNSWRGEKGKGVIRTITKTNTTGIYLDKSFLPYPKASLLEFDGDTFKIFKSGERELNEAEKKVMENEPRDEEQEKNDMLSDGSTMFYRRRQYYKEKGYFYLFGTETQNGKRLSNNHQKIVDDNLKGEVEMIYKIIKGGV